MKKIIAILLALLVFGSTCFAFDAKGLSDLGLVFSDNREELVLRKNFVKNLVNLLDISPMADSPQLYSDVTPGMLGYGEIMAAYNADIIYGTNKMEFRPDEPITYKEAINIFIKLLGYDIYLNQGQNDRLVAANMGLTKGISYTNNAWMNYENLIKMYSNIIDIPMLEVTKTGTKYSVEEGKTLFGAYRDLVFKEGIVQASGKESISKNINPTEKIAVIDGVTYDIENVKAEEYVGMRVHFVYEESDYGQIIRAICPVKECTVLDLNLQDVDLYASMALEYMDNGKARKIRFNSETTILYNGELITKYNTKIFNGDNGTVRFINNNNDNYYDVIFINEYEDYIVGRISDGVVFDKYKTDENGAPLTLDLSKIDDRVFFRMSGKNFTISDVLKDNVISVLKSDAGVVTKVILSLNTAEGIVESVEDNILSLDGEEFYLTEDFCKKNSVELGESVKVYLNAVNNVIAMTSYGVSGYNYGYLMDLIHNTDTDQIYARMLTADNSIKRYELRSKLTLDGKRKQYKFAEVNKSFSDGYGFLPQIVRYRIGSNDTIISIDTKKVASANGETDKNSLVCSFQKETLKYIKNSITFSGRIAASSDSVIFKVPDESSQEVRGTYGDKYYSVTNTSQLVDSQDISVEGYGTDIKNYIPEAFVIYTEESGGVTGIQDSERLSIVTNISQSLKEDGEVATKIVYLKGTEELSACFENDNIITESLPEGKTLKVGDVIRVKTNSFGEINGLQYIYSVDDGTDDTTEFHSGISNSEFGGRGTFVLTKLNFIKHQDGFGFFAKNAEIVEQGEITLSQMFVSDIRDTTVVIYDPNEIPKVKLSTIDELHETYGEEPGDMIITKTYYNLLQTIYAIRK